MENSLVQSSRGFDSRFVPSPTPRASKTALDLSVEPSGDASIVRVRTSKLTYPVLSAFFDQVGALLEQGTRSLVLDLEAVSYIDSATIGCLVELHHRVADSGGAVKLVSLQRRVHTMLSMTGVDRFLEVFEDEGEALASLGWTGEGPRQA